MLKKLKIKEQTLKSNIKMTARKARYADRIPSIFIRVFIFLNRDLASIMSTM